MKIKVSVEYRKYCSKHYFIFDSDDWRDRLFIDKPLEALKTINRFLNDRNIELECKVDLVKLYEMIRAEEKCGTT